MKRDRCLSVRLKSFFVMSERFIHSAETICEDGLMGLSIITIAKGWRESCTHDTSVLLYNKSTTGLHISSL